MDSYPDASAIPHPEPPVGDRLCLERRAVVDPLQDAGRAIRQRALLCCRVQPSPSQASRAILLGCAFFKFARSQFKNLNDWTMLLNALLYCCRALEGETWTM